MYEICEQRSNEVLEGHLHFFSTTRFSLSSDRRDKPRLHETLPARIWGIDHEDELISLDCLVDNLSSSGLLLRLPWRMKVSSQISVVVRLLNASGEMAAIKGEILRDERHLDGSRGIAVRITEYRFL